MSAQVFSATTAPRLPSMPGRVTRLLSVLAWLVAVAAAWELLVMLLHVRPSTLPRPSAILQAVASTPQPYVDGFLRTFAEAATGFLAGAVVGVAIAMAFSRNEVLKDMVFPLFIVSQTIPVIAFGALVVLWFGNTLLAKAVIAFYVTFFPVTINTLAGLKSVDPRQMQLLRSFGATGRKLFWSLQLPAALPQIFVALRLGASLSLVGAIVGEWFGDTTGLGVLLLQAMYNENSVGLWAALLACALLGTLCYAAVAWVERRVVFWGSEQ
jgi:NitT/TauT family transport system permease protein